MSNELVPKDPNQLKIEPSSGEFAKPDKTRQVNAAILGPKQVPDKTSPLPSSPRLDTAVLRGSPPSAHALSYEKPSERKDLRLPYI